MSLVSQVYWDCWMGDMPMPADCDIETMWAMYDAVQTMKDREYAAEQIKWYETLWRKHFPNYDGDKNNETLAGIMKLIKDGIVYWGKELTE